MAKSQSGGKSKRTQSEAKRGKRAACWRRAEARHEQNAAGQERQHRANVKLRIAGELTAWETACLVRARSRMHLYAAWAKRFPELAANQKEARERVMRRLAKHEEDLVPVT